MPGRLSKKYVVSLGASEEKVFIAPNATDNELFIKISEKYRKRRDQIKAYLRIGDGVAVLCIA